MMPNKDLAGRRFGRWIVLERAPRLPHRMSQNWICRCDCGAEKSVRGRSLVIKESTSCGCFREENKSRLHTKHGHSPTGNYSPTYKSWSAMHARCKYKHFIGAKYYAERGITVCDRWRKFENFLADMGERPPRTSLDRVDTNGGYEPGNCRWATYKQQGRNRRNVRLIEFNGETLSIPEWAERLGIHMETMRKRFRKLSVVSALTTPVHENKKRAFRQKYGFGIRES
jgi:hypothetical protein